MHILILAGGGGTRLWPFSREDFPKQFLHFGDQESLLQKSIRRFLSFSLAESISVVTNTQYQKIVEQQIEKIDPVKKLNIIVEPERKNTAPAIAFAVKFLEGNHLIQPDASLLVLPSDHYIEPEEVLLSYLEKTLPLIETHHLVLFGITPTKPETGYGYIQKGKNVGPHSFQVSRFIEKPETKKAEEYLVSGEYLWNSGMFAFSSHLFWRQLSILAPDIFSLVQGDLPQIVNQFSQMPSISFDYAILEKTKETLVCPLPVIWSDVGCWDSIYDMLEKDQNQNVKSGNILEIDTKNSLIFGGKRLISTIGLEDLLIVETDDATFISKKGESQKVKQLVQELIQAGNREGTNHTTKQFSWGTISLLHDNPQYSIQKIELFPKHSFEPIIPSQLTLLEGTAIVKTSLSLEKMQLLKATPITKKTIIANPDETTAQILLLCALSFFSEVPNPDHHNPQAIQKNI